MQEGGAELSTLRTLTVATKALGPASESIPAVFGGEVANGCPMATVAFSTLPSNSTDPKDPKGNLDTKARLHRRGHRRLQADAELLSRVKVPGSWASGPTSTRSMYFSDDDMPSSTPILAYGR